VPHDPLGDRNCEADRLALGRRGEGLPGFGELGDDCPGLLNDLLGSIGKLFSDFLVGLQLARRCAFPSSAGKAFGVSGLRPGRPEA